MFNRSKRASLWTALFVGFVDHMGIGLIYPLFSAMLFDEGLALVPPDASLAVRGIWLGVLIALMPLTEFLSSPFWGALSDTKGRKKPLQMSMSIALCGYLTATLAVLLNNIILLLLSRVIIGFAAGNISIVQAAVADLSSEDEKAKNFGLYGMALGAGFALGPFFGGVFAAFGYSMPFIFATVIVALNLLFTRFFFKETHFKLFEKKLNWAIGFHNFKKAFHYKGLRVVLFASFLHCFAWSYFFEFIPVYLISTLQFTAGQLGLFYGIAGASYSISSGLLIRPLVGRFKPESLFFAGNLLTGLVILSMPFLSSSLWVYIFLALLCYFVAFVFPTVSTIVSNRASSDIQGESLGIFSAVNAMAFMISPLLSGFSVGDTPSLPMWLGGSMMLLTALIIFSGLIICKK